MIRHAMSQIFHKKRKQKNNNNYGIFLIKYENMFFVCHFYINPCHSLFFWSGSFAVQYGDHLRSGIICRPIWGSFAVRDHMRSWDHLRTRTQQTV